MKIRLLGFLLFGFIAWADAQTTVFSEDFTDIFNLPGSTTLLTEGFEDVPGLANNGWLLLNKSNPVGTLTNSYFQGETNVFTAETGSNNGYAGVNFNSTGAQGTISSWMITPELTVQNGDIITFWSRTVLYDPGATEYADRLEFRMSTAGENSVNPTDENSLGTFTNKLLSINPDLNTSVYPQTWTRYNMVVSGLSGPTSCKFAFRYFVTNGGPGGSNSNYVGIDTFTIKRPLWTILNKSNPIGAQPSGWFQGNPNVFDAQAGFGGTQYAGANYNSTGPVGTISSWFITPVMSLQNQDVVSFWTRTAENPNVSADRLEVRLSALGENSVYPSDENSVGSFTTLLATVNPNLDDVSYPTTWTEFTSVINSLAGQTNCRIAFRYYVLNGGINGGNSNYIGVDTFSVTRSNLSTINLDGNNISIYPNPVNETLHIDFQEAIKGNVSVVMYDLLGKEVLRYDNGSLDTTILKIPLNVELSKGIYVLKILADGRTYTQKISKV
ncbi:MAG: hypothetical protein CFE23_01090 [Flavobacterium sp. BFFFF1]|uniref:T9SS-dependent choice-of-anchor J family protein n=1 Tax=Flavobacterium sp. BFFFF1 TaxID=2015557 RepID=UPI000BD3101A|nr:choice-of-anchor J domain-containing protein [Flavobacterium sp. BFFFF1]OYU82343.1 MAG: hypothetical protein CFE23_01090 [Flavobacterium sp. BFFFF1]